MTCQLPVILYFLLSACELIQIFACKKRSCNNYTDTNATVQNLLAWDLCTPVVLHLCYSVIIHRHKKFKSLYKHVDIDLKQCLLSDFRSAQEFTLLRDFHLL